MQKARITMMYLFKNIILQHVDNLLCFILTLTNHTTNSQGKTEEDEFKLRGRDVALAIAWIENNKNKLSGTIRYPIAITMDDIDVIQRLEELGSKPGERWGDEDKDFFNCAWEFQFSMCEDLEYAISELHDKQHLHLHFAF